MVDPSSQKAIREFMDSPTQKAIRKFMDSPTQSAMREFMDSPTQRAMREFMDSPTQRAIREFMDSPTQRAIREFMDSPTQRAMREFMDSPTQKAIREAARVNQWASQLGDKSTDMLLALMPTRSPILEEAERIRSAAASMLSKSAAVDHPSLTNLGLNAHLSADMEATRLKLATLAGSGDVLGFESRASFAAYEGLFGRWHTRPDLPQRFWRDLATRRRHYHEAEVDPGLIETTPGGAVEAVIDSGFSAGVSEGGSPVALFEIAGLVMRVRSNNPSVDAFRAVGAFEHALRQFIASKLETVAGPQWFKQRVNGEARKKARDNRAAAMANGESETALIAYLDIGDLIAILLRKDNWDRAFGHVFPDRQRLGFDLQALIATRRPTMHARNIDAVRLVELMCIIRRLTQWIEMDGEWKTIAESED
jgi:hypothetical protein